MPAKIRLQRKGKKGRPFYHIVIADGRAPRDGKFIEKIGIYNPISKPAEIDLQIDRAMYWLQAGAMPTDTVRTLFSHKGVMYKYHLLKGVKKGALTEEQAEMKFQEWVREKQEKLLARIREQELETKEGRKKRLAEEAKIKEDRSKELAAKREKEMKAARAEEDAAIEDVAETPAAEAEAEPVAEVTEQPQEEPAAEIAAAEEPAAEEPAAEEPAAEEPAAEEPAAEEPAAEEPVAEAKAEEAPAEEIADATETEETEPVQEDADETEKAAE